MFWQKIINFDQCCSPEILSVYQVGAISIPYYNNGYTYEIANKQNKSAEEQGSPVYMISHFETIKTESGKSKYVKKKKR